MANVLDAASNGGGTRERPVVYGHPGDWERLIRGFVIWGLSILAFACGAVAMLTTFGARDQMAFLAERTAKLGSIISRTNEIDERVGALANEIQKVEHKEAGRDAQAKKIDRVENSALNLSQEVRNLADEVRTKQANFDEHLGVVEDKISQIELRLYKSEENEHTITKLAIINQAPPSASIQTPVSEPHGNSIANFSIIRVTGDSAWVAGPQGWFHVQVGSLLPGGAKILEIGVRDNRPVVLTDQGAITKGQ